MEFDVEKVKDNAELALRCITYHCMWCADCDWENNPDPTCGCFAEFWMKVRKEKRMSRSAKECYKELVAALCKNYGEYVYELRREHKTEEDNKRVFEALKSTANAESALELFWLASNEHGLRIALQAMTEGFDKKDIETVSKEIDDIIRRREEIERPPETYRGE